MIALSPLQLPGNGTARQLRCRVLQSPLAGVSDRIFRGLVRRWAPDALLFTEMVNATSPVSYTHLTLPTICSV